MEKIEVICYNKGCGLRFDPNLNSEDKCRHHSGAPIFHDVYKKWSCCNKKSRDFTTFLSMEGCTVGKHNPVKPKEEPKPKPSLPEQEIVSMKNSAEKVDVPRKSFDTVMVSLAVNVNPKLKEVLAVAESTMSASNTEMNTDDIKLGENCKNNGCKIVYEGVHSKLTECIYHPGVPVFHEGLKFWSCCQKKTSDFDVFLDQKGCTNGSHVFKKQQVTKANCRYDWHQTGQHVYITIYAKHCQPHSSPVKANQIRIYANIVFADNNTFELDNELIGVVNPAESIVTMFPSKIEIKLKKADVHQWRELFVPKVPEKTDATVTHNNAVDPRLDLKAVDLTDI